MRQYKIYEHPSGMIDIVKQGWSWPAFFFSAIWAMAKKLWGLAAAALSAFLVLGLLDHLIELGAAGSLLIDLLWMVAIAAFGSSGNRWREKNLEKRGYECVDTVTAANADGALALYLQALKRGVA